MTADLSCMYATRALFHLMKEANDPLHEQLLDKNYKFPSVDSLNQVSSRTQVLSKKYFYEYWNQGGREHTFMKAKKMEKFRFEKFYSLLFISLFLFVFHSNILLSFCSSSRKKLLLMRSYRGSNVAEPPKL